MSRFDGALAGWAFAPKWRWNVVAGRPAEALAQTKRRFYGTSIDADGLTEHIGGSVYFNEQRIDGYVDRRAVGVDLRYVDSGVFVSSNVDYDLGLKALNIASVQGMWQRLEEDGSAGTTVNALFDRRAQPLVALGNVLFFPDPGGSIVPVTIDDALRLRDMETLRSYLRTTTAYSTQALLGVTTPLSKRWQIGGDVRLTRIDAIPAVPDILPFGQAATGNIWGLGGQLIGTNLYSERDTHVFVLSAQRAAAFNGILLAYNNVTVLDGGWQIEPNVQYYQQQQSSDGMKLSRINPGLRASYRVMTQAVLESALDYEISRLSSSVRNENTHRIFYYLGGRYEF